jgi:hypothetical protein
MGPFRATAAYFLLGLALVWLGLKGWPWLVLVTTFLVLLLYSVLKHCAHIRCTHIVCTYSIRSAHVYYIVGVSSMHSSLCSSSMYSYCFSIVHALVTMFLVHVLVLFLYRPCTRHYVPRPCTRIVSLSSMHSSLCSSSMYS